MTGPTDLGQVTVKDILAGRIGKEAADRVVKQLNDAHQQGERGDDLKKHFKDAMANEGHDIGSEHSGILYGFFVP
jgi:hypothetical protein